MASSNRCAVQTCRMILKWAWERKHACCRLQLQQEYGAEGATYFAIPWLYEECYLYRRIRGAQLGTQTLQDLDPFMGVKTDAWASSAVAVTQICQRYAANRDMVHARC